MKKYDILNQALEVICKEAPSTYKSYLPSEKPEENIKRFSLAYIHLYLKVKFGISDFVERHALITDGTNDGGLDAYYIDSDNKKLYLIQSKYRANAKNFENKSIDADELLSMEISRITKGVGTDSNGVNYNSKIIDFQNKLKSIRDIAKYDYIVVILANVKHNDEKIRRLIDNSEYIVFDHEKTYSDLIFPLTAGTFYDPDEITIKLNLAEKTSLNLKQSVESDYGSYSVTVLFVPCIEIAKMLSKYKNSVLKFNPRCYLSLAKDSVNDKIKNEIISSKKNNFALLNNGLTVLSDNVQISESTGEVDAGQLILTRPQILNGGQTAFTLSLIYDGIKNNDYSCLEGKEVLVKIVTRRKDGADFDRKFVQMISNATNQQSEVIEADRRSNHEIQLSIQKDVFDKFGYFYERKHGEFFDGVNQKVINKKLVIDRLDFIKAYYAYKGVPAAARRSNEKELFKETKFTEILADGSSIEYKFFAWKIFSYLVELERKEGKAGVIKYGNALKYGKWCVIYSIALRNPNVQADNIDGLVELEVQKSLDKWLDFDEYIKNRNIKENSKYFNSKTSNYELYYKINEINEDVKNFFLK